MTFEKELENEIPDRLTAWQRIGLALFNRAYLETKPHPETGHAIDRYLFRCDKHGLQVSYAMDHGAKLVCIKCLKESKKEAA